MAKGTGSAVWVRTVQGVGWSGRTRIRQSSPSARRRSSSGPDDVLVDLLDGLDLALDVGVVAGLVGGLDVHADQVARVQGRDGRGALAGVVGVQVAGGAVDLDALPADQPGQARGPGPRR